MMHRQKNINFVTTLLLMSLRERW